MQAKNEKGNKVATKVTEATVNITALRNSPINGIKPMTEDLQWVPLDKIEVDPTNPGGITSSLRYQRREPSMQDSYDIIGGKVYSVLICQHTDPEKQRQGIYIVVDGHGRYDQARRRNQASIQAIVYPPLTLEQRICLRETLGAAQESFDAISVIEDLRLLAVERQLSLDEPDDIKVLIRDLPEKVRRREKDLLTLARWDPEAMKRLGESYSIAGNTIGIEKVKELTGIVDAVKKAHPQTYETLGRDHGITKKLAKMYLERKFSQGTRSQDAIRQVRSAITELPSNEPLVRRFIRDELSQEALAPFAKKGSSLKDIASVCQALVQRLLALDPAALNDEELRMLRRTNLQIAETLKEAGVTGDE
jgi:hypothetical protein